MPRQKRELTRAVIFLVDGVSTTTLEQLVERGSVPTLARYMRQGSYHPNVVASFPTVTGPAHIPLFAGLNPASINIVGHNQFIREEERLENYLLHYRLLSKRFGNRPSLYQHFKNSAAIAEPFRVGATTYRKNVFSLADWATIQGPGNGYVLGRVRHEYQRGRDLVIAWLHETDGLAHMSPSDRLIERSLIAFDRFIARFEQEVDQHTVLVVCSDHGMQRTDGRPFSVRTALVKSGLKHRDFRYFLDGGAFAQVYLRRDGSIRERLSQKHLGQLPERLVGFSEIDLVLHRREQAGQTSVVVRSQAGRAVISRSAGRYHYQLEEGRDPLGLLRQGAQSFVDHDAADCVDATARNRYPDGHYQVFELLSAPACGDLVITAAPNKGFNNLTRFGVHGGLNREQSVTFLLFNQPMLGLGVDCLRTADLYRIIRQNVHPQAH